MQAVTKIRFLLLVLLASALVACGGGGGGGNESAGEPVGQVVTTSIDSRRTGATYPVSVYLPESYGTGTRTYPVIYAVEGDAKFGYGPAFNETRFEAFKQVMQERGTEAILVGIGRTDRRNIDFLLPGAEQYLAFITRELVPRIQSQYRVDPTRRALSGLSHGGYFVFAAFILQGSAGTVTFSHFLSTEASTGGGDPNSVYAFEQRLADSGNAVPTTLFMAGGAAGTTNGVFVQSLHDRIRSRDYTGLKLAHMGFATSHVGTDVPAFEEALRRYFP